MGLRRTRWLLPALTGPVLGLTVLALTAGGLAMGGPAAASTQASGGLQARSAAVRPATGAASTAGVGGYLRWEPGTDPTTTYNSTGGQVFVTQLAAGDTLVSFAGITGNGGDAQVSTPITNASCSLEFVTTVALERGQAMHAQRGASPAAASEHDFLVQCYDQNGTQTDEPFDLLVAHAPAKPQGVLDYAWVYTGAHGNLNTDPRFRPFQFNSTHKVNSVAHPRTGVYVVTMPGAGSAGSAHGTVSVSPVGPGAGNCQVETWTATKTAQKITVVCSSAIGRPGEQAVHGGLRARDQPHGPQRPDRRQRLVRSGGGVYQPATQFDSKAKAKVTVEHTNRGQYVVLFGGSSPTGKPNGGNGHIQVTAAGPRLRHCGYTIIPTHTPELDVNCAGPGGTLVDSAFIVQWVVS